MIGKIALDTDVAIRFLNGDSVVAALLSKYSDIYLPSVVVGELMYGALNSKHAEQNTARHKKLIQRAVVLGITESTAYVYAKTRLNLKNKGRPIPENDVWIASVCIEHRILLVSYDKHFKDKARSENRFIVRPQESGLDINLNGIEQCPQYRYGCFVFQGSQIKTSPAFVFDYSKDMAEIIITIGLARKIQSPDKILRHAFRLFIFYLFSQHLYLILIFPYGLIDESFAHCHLPASGKPAIESTGNQSATRVRHKRLETDYFLSYPSRLGLTSTKSYFIRLCPSLSEFCSVSGRNKKGKEYLQQMYENMVQALQKQKHKILPEIPR